MGGRRRDQRFQADRQRFLLRQRHLSGQSQGHERHAVDHRRAGPRGSLEPRPGRPDRELGAGSVRPEDRHGLRPRGKPVRRRPRVQDGGCAALRSVRRQSWLQAPRLRDLRPAPRPPAGHRVGDRVGGRGRPPSRADAGAVSLRSRWRTDRRPVHTSQWERPGSRRAPPLRWSWSGRAGRGKDRHHCREIRYQRGDTPRRGSGGRGPRDRN